MTIALLYMVLTLACCGSDDQLPVSQTIADNNSNQIAFVQPTSTPAVESKPVDYFAHMKPEHRRVLQQWLKSKPNLRPAVEEIDSSAFPGNEYGSPEGDLKFLRDTVGENGYQYYAVGDMNQDGKPDFAVLLVDMIESKDDNDQVALAIFNAPFNSKASPDYFEKGLHGISNIYIVFDLMEKKHLFLGKLESDFYCATYYPKGRTYYFKDCDL